MLREEVVAVRVFAVEEHPLMLEGIRRLLEADAGIVYCGGATDVAEALTAIRNHHPDVCIVDAQLLESIDLIGKIRSLCPETRVLVLSLSSDRFLAERAFRAGAVGYLEKALAPRHLLEAVRHCRAGNLYLSPEATRAMLRRLHSSAIESPSGVESLSEREYQIFRHLGLGLTNPEIAEQCSLSVRTVETYYSRIKEKLHLANTAQLRQFAIRWARENGAALLGAGQAAE